MKEKILKDLKKINLTKIFNLKDKVNLIDSNSLIDLKISEDNLVMVINIFPLSITREKSQDLETLLNKKLKSFKKNIKIIFTNNDQTGKDNAKPAKIEDAKEQKQSNEKFPKNNKIKIDAINKIILVSSGKGGVGKSTLSVNLALTLNRIGYKTAIIDGDIYGPSISHMLNLEDEPKLVDKKIIPYKAFNIKAISVANFVPDSEALVWRGPMVSKMINQLFLDVNWSYDKEKIDYLIVDLPPGTGDVSLNICQQFDIAGSIIVSTPQEVALIDAIRAYSMFEKLNIPIIGVVQNMSYLIDESGNKNYLFGCDGAKKMAQENKLNFLGDIPISSQIREAGDLKKPIVIDKPSSNSAFSYGIVAENIINQLDNSNLLLR